MSYWNHRVVRHTDKTIIDGVEETETWHAIHEVYYDDDGHPNGYTENEVGPIGETLLDLSRDIQRFAEALSKPVLVHEDFFPTPASVHARDVEPDAVETTRIALSEAETPSQPKRLDSGKLLALTAPGLGGKDTRAQDNIKALLDLLQDGYDEEHGTDSRPLSTVNIGSALPICGCGDHITPGDMNAVGCTLTDEGWTCGTCALDALPMRPQDALGARARLAPGTSSSADELISKLQDGIASGFTPVDDIGDVYPKELNLADTFGRRPETGTGVEHEATLEEARAAKVKLLNRIKDEPWLKGVGLGHSFSGYNIQVRVDSAYDLAGAQLPLVVDDVQVCVAITGNIKPQGEMKVFSAPVDRHVEAAQKDPGTEIPCPFCKGRVLPRKEWLTGTWCCTKQYKARGMQGY